MVICLCVLPVAGCYYWQAAQGQLALSQAREPIERVLSDTDVPTDTRRRLTLARDAVSFAHSELGLPDNGSYQHYVALDRDYVVVNVFAADAFSLSAKTWCYPFVGCVSYRGYFREAAATEKADRLADKGLDTHTAKVPAYSTLGRLKDPVLSTMLRRTDAGLVGLMFHELAHQRVFVSGDTAFNESFATAVADIGLQRWQQLHTEIVPEGDVHRRALRKQAFELLGGLREDLGEIYQQSLAPADMRLAKEMRFERFALDWKNAGLKSKPPQNNAALIPLAVYNDYGPAFSAIYVKCDAQLGCFYDEVEALAQLEKPERDEALQALMPLVAD